MSEVFDNRIVEVYRLIDELTPLQTKIVRLNTGNTYIERVSSANEKTIRDSLKDRLEAVLSAAPTDKLEQLSSLVSSSITSYLANMQSVKKYTETVQAETNAATQDGAVEISEFALDNSYSPGGYIYEVRVLMAKGNSSVPMKLMLTNSEGVSFVSDNYITNGTSSAWKTWTFSDVYTDPWLPVIFNFTDQENNKINAKVRTNSNNEYHGGSYILPVGGESIDTTKVVVATIKSVVSL